MNPHHFKKTLSFAAVIFLLFAGSSLFWGASPAAVLREKKLVQSFSSLEEGSVSLKDAVPFEWERLYSFSPYVSKEDMERELGFQSTLLRETVSEGMVQLIFTKGDRVVCQVTGYPDTLGFSFRFPKSAEKNDSCRLLLSSESVFLDITKHSDMPLLTARTENGG